MKFKLAELVEIKYGKDYKHLSKGRVPLYGSGGIMGYVDRSLYNKESILIPRKGTLNNIIYVDDPFWSVDTMFYTVLSGKVNGKFLYYLLKTIDFASMNVGSAVPSMTSAILNELELDIPEMPVQLKIASILSSLDDKIELNRQTNQTLEAIAHALFKEWFVDFNFPGATGEMEESELGMIPKAWTVGKLEDIVELNPKLSIKKGEFAKYVEMKDLSQTSLSIEKFIERQFSSGSKFQNNDTLFARITPCLENGKTGFVDFLKENEIGWGSTEFIVLRSKSAASFFVYCLSRYNKFREFAIQSMVGSSGRQRVVESILADYQLASPPAEVSALFHKAVAAIFRQIKENHEQTKTLATMRDNLLPKLMKGEISIS